MYSLSDKIVHSHDAFKSVQLFPGFPCLACLLVIFTIIPVYANDELVSLQERLAASQKLDKAKIAAKIAQELRQADADQALHYSQLGLRQLELTPHEPTRINLINTRAVAYLQKRDYPSTLLNADQALLLARENNLPLEEAKALNTLGALNWYQGDLEQARDYFESSLALRKKQGAVAELSPALNNLGVLEEIRGRYTRAIEFYLQAIESAERIGNNEQLARPISNLGVLHQMLKNFDKALLFNQWSLKLNIEGGNWVGAALSHNNISEIQIEKGEYEAALKSLQEGLILLDKIEAPQEKALLLVNSGSAHLHLKNPASALALFDQASLLVSQFNSNEIDTYLAQGYAGAYFQKSLLNQALKYAQEFLILAQAQQDLNSIKKAQHLHYKIYKEKGLYVQALAAHENFNRIQGDLTSRENTAYATRLQAEFDSEKQEKELAILQKQNVLQEIRIKRQQFLRNLIAVLSLALLLFGYFIYHIRTIRMKTVVLESKVAERTREIQHKNSAIAELLRQKDKLLERKNVLFSTVSHEFRTPLTLIMGPLKQLTHNTSHRETRLTLNNVLRNATRLYRMVDQLLDLARIDMQAELSSEPLDVASALGFLITSMETLFQEHNITVNLRLENNIWIEISPEAFEKAAVNLLSNAVKYTPHGGKIGITAEARHKTVVISISDTGIGIAKDQQERIFERFTRLENPLSKPIAGAGIGLALVKELVECYKGKIEVASELNQGSTFTLVFPATPIAAISAQQGLRSTACENELAALTAAKFNAINLAAIKTEANKKSEWAPERSSTVLIVEDNDEMRTFIGNQLKPHYQCLYANDGKQGVKLAINEIPDLIVSDLMMPQLNGLQLAATLKEDPLTSHIPIIILTAKGDPETRHAAWRKNVDEYIEKPFDTDELLLRCENILSIRQILTQRFNSKESMEKHKEDTASKINNVAAMCFSKRDQEFLDKLYCFVEGNFYESELNARLISSALAITEKQLQRKVKALTQDTIPAFVRNFRLKKGADMLTAGASVTSVAFDVGFSSQSYFSTAFAARYGCSPRDYQDRQRKRHKKLNTYKKADASVG